jgi:phospholipase/carboxylesterase
LIACAAWLLVPSPAAAQANALRLSVKPSAAAMALPAGISRLSHDAYAYRPRHLSAGLLPLIVLLHGGGGKAYPFLQRFMRTADRHGAILVAPQSAGSAWDVVLAAHGKGALGADAPRLNAVLAELFAKAPIDPQRIVLLGMSNGASYALSLGLGNPQLFRGVIALSPGFAFPPIKTDPTQRLFIAHGRHDNVLPPDNVRDSILPAVIRAGSVPRVRWFNGGHEIDPATLEEGVAYALRETD